ncbi:MAG: aldehyde dehydrogenase family protein [Bacteroidales bacterium]|nr:aldehyde dehydrogenase family protein [Bacteroidales bacterium]
MALQNTPTEKIEEIVSSQRDFLATGKTREVSFRKEMLIRLRDGLKKWEPELSEALIKDLHKSYEEAFMTEFGILYGEISEALRKVGRWSRRKKVRTPMMVMPSKSYIVREPLGCALIVSPWNYPVQLLLNPLVGAISAGCTAVLKPSPYVPNVSSVLGKMIGETFPEEYVAVVQGDRSVNSVLFGTKFDIVFFTGSPALARVLSLSQSKYLTPMVLELGGKSPCIVDKNADIELAARRIAWGKCLNSGQTCIAPDYLFIHEDVKESFVREFGKAVGELYPEGTDKAEHYVHMVRDAAFERVVSYLKDGEILYGGHFDRDSRWIEPTLLGSVSPDSPVMTEEIFGPVFPVLTFRDRREVEEFVCSREKPLAFYYFGAEKDGWDLISKTSSGGACINDTIMHIANSALPFGGVGNSGMGSYHRERSFLAFTHERAVLSTPTWIDLPFRYMPYKFFSLAKKLLQNQ